MAWEDAQCNGYGTLRCYCGGDFCVCGCDGEPCIGCPECEDYWGPELDAEFDDDDDAT